MKALLYYISLFFLLLSGGNSLYAETNQSATHFSFAQNKGIKEQVKHKSSRHHSALKESTDIDFDEEYHTNDAHDLGTNKFLARKQSLLSSWYLANSRQIIFKDYSKDFKNFAPFSVYSNPIYLRIGVFRI